MEKLLTELCKSQLNRDKWFSFCCENSPIVSASMDYGKSYGLTEDERMKVAVILLVEKESKRLTEEWIKHDLAEIIPTDSVGAWFKTPNPAFDGQTPIQIVESGEPDRIWRMLAQINANVAN